MNAFIYINQSADVCPTATIMLLFCLGNVVTFLIILISKNVCRPGANISCLDEPETLTFLKYLHAAELLISMAMPLLSFNGSQLGLRFYIVDFGEFDD